MRTLPLIRFLAPAAMAIWFAGPLSGQVVIPERDSTAAAPLVDEIVIDNRNVFDAERAASNWLYRTANSFRVRTRQWVVRREILIAEGEPADSALLAETERNLRALGLFREVRVDTTRVDDRLVLWVFTRDAWSTRPIVKGRFASDGTLTGSLGLLESNFLGTGNMVRGEYRKDVDRDGADLRFLLNRVSASEVLVAGNALLLSDGSSGGWLVGDPWRSLDDRTLVLLGGFAGDERRPRYRTLAADRRDTTEFRRHVYRQDLTIGRAVRSRPGSVLRVGLLASYRNERIVSAADSLLPVPDSVFGDLGLFVSYIRPRFRIARYVDGLNRQDVDLSTEVTLSARLASSGFGYASTGVGPSLLVGSGWSAGPAMLRADLLAQGLFNAAGLDSGRVVLAVRGARPTENRHVTLLHLAGGLLDNPTPGDEFDLGFSVGPRGFEPHSFVGTRALWGTVEHRWYAFPAIFQQFGLGVAAYFDFGGAWYPDQGSRWGGEVGIGLRTATRLGARARSSRIDLGYLLGPGLDGRRLVLSVSSGVQFF